MMVAFMSLAGAGFFGAKIGMGAPVGLLIVHLIYGLVRGATYGLLGVLVPVKAAPILTKEEKAELVAGGPNPYTMDSGDINDHLPTSSPSGKTVLIIFGGLVGFFVLVVLVVEFRTTLGL